MRSSEKKPLATPTLLVTAGRDTAAQKGFVNPPIVRGSTVLYPTADDLHNERGDYSYGRQGTPTSRAFCEALAAIEGPRCAGVALLPSGLAAITAALLSVLKAGDHLLVSDSAYRPTRKVCDGLLTRFGIETTYFDPLIGDGIGRLFKPNTRAVFIETPGSQSFEMPDTLAIAGVAKEKGALVINDNTWATPLYFRSLEKGVDLTIQAVTKYIGGHSDIMFGSVAANEKAWPALNETMYLLGECAGPDDIFLAMRGLRTLAVRLAHHQAAALEMANWLAARPEVLRVLHPALPSDPGHARNAISPARAGCSASCSNLSHRRRSTPCSIRWNCSAWAFRGAASKASSFRSTARPIAPRRSGIPAGRRCACTSALRAPTI